LSRSFLTFPCCQAGLQGLSKPEAPVQSGGSYGLAFTPSLLLQSVSPSALALLPTSPPVISASSHGIRAASTADISHPASTPTRPESPTSVAGYYTDNMFRPRGFSPPRRFTPQASCEFIAPHCRLEVRCVSCLVVHMHTAEAALCGTGPYFSPQRVSHPSKDSPHLQPYRVATAVALLTLPPSYLLRRGCSRCEVFPRLAPACYLSIRGRLASAVPRCQGAVSACFPRTQLPSRLCSADESVLPPSRCQLARQPILPWALFPSKVT
jgi:hypothetical protein